MTETSSDQDQRLEILDPQQVLEELRKKSRELEEAQRVIRDMKDRLALALDAASLGSYDLDLATGKMECSAQCKSNYGLPLDATFNFPDLLNAINPEYRASVQQKVNTAIANHEVYMAEYQVTWPDGSKHWINAFGKTKYAADNTPQRIIGVTLNITERKKLEQQKDDFLGIASHELKTPLTTLKASLQLLNRLKDEQSDELMSQLIATSHKSMEKLSVLVDDLLNNHQWNEGSLPINKKMVNLAQLVADACAHIQLTEDHQLKVEGDAALRVCADEHRIEQVVVNFVNNAVKYAPDSKGIYLSVEQENGNAKVSVKDDGPGIPAEHIGHLFDRYWRADRSGYKYSGLGMGLYICAEIIRKHNGKIGVDSVLGEGSTFWFTIPL